MAALLEDRSFPVTADCGELDYISSAGLGVIMETYKRLHGPGPQPPARERLAAHPERLPLRRTRPGDRDPLGRPPAPGPAGAVFPPTFPPGLCPYGSQRTRKPWYSGPWQGTAGPSGNWSVRISACCSTSPSACCNDREDARDVTQTAFLKAWRKLHTLRPAEQVLQLDLPDPAQRGAQPAASQAPDGTSGRADGVPGAVPGGPDRGERDRGHRAGCD